MNSIVYDLIKKLYYESNILGVCHPVFPTVDNFRHRMCVHICGASEELCQWHF